MTDGRPDEALDGLHDLLEELGANPPTPKDDDGDGGGGDDDGDGPFIDRAGGGSGGGGSAGPLSLPWGQRAQIVWQRWKWAAATALVIITVANIARVCEPALERTHPDAPVTAPIRRAAGGGGVVTPDRPSRPSERPTVPPPVTGWPPGVYQEIVPIIPGTPGYTSPTAPPTAPPTTTTTQPSTTTTRLGA